MDLQGKYAFISHPYSQSPEKNKAKVEKICKYWVRQGVIPISPLHLFAFYENDDEREKIMEFCYRLIDNVDVVLKYGNSEGCLLERRYAESIGVPVLLFYNRKEKRKPNYTECYYLMREKG